MSTQHTLVTARYQQLVGFMELANRAARGWKVRAAARLGISPSHLSKILSGDRAVGIEVATRASERLRMPLEFFTADPLSDSDLARARRAAEVAMHDDPAAASLLPPNLREVPRSQPIREAAADRREIRELPVDRREVREASWELGGPSRHERADRLARDSGLPGLVASVVECLRGARDLLVASDDLDRAALHSDDALVIAEEAHRLAALITQHPIVRIANEIEESSGNRTVYLLGRLDGLLSDTPTDS